VWREDTAGRAFRTKYLGDSAKMEALQKFLDDSARELEPDSCAVVLSRAPS
jgi:hypothetical protein